MKYLAVALFAFFSLSVSGQECDCEATFDWVKKTFEENDAGFQYIVDKKGIQTYALHNQIHEEKTKKTDDPVACETIVRNWLSFFRKAHVEFHYKEKAQSKANNQNEVEQNPEAEKIKNDPKYRLHNQFLNSEVPFVEQLNEKTIYLRIPAFSGQQKPLIDSIVLAHRSKILSTENLIIDIRNGEGGNDDSYEKLMPLIYTNPIRLPTVELLSTPLNNQRMYEMATNTGMALQFGVNPSEAEKKQFMAYYDTLSNHIGEFVNLKAADVTITKFDTIHPFPQNVAIMINHNNVSTDEQFLLEAKQSKKVKLFGTTTKGAIDVSNLYITHSPCDNYVLVYALSRSLRIPDMVVDDIGIMPDYYIDKGIPEQEWINYVSGILKE
ncbi:MAG: S41 family peptidase [Chitinophagales bacterium]